MTFLCYNIYILKFIVFYVGFAKEDLYSMSRRTKGEGTIRKRSDGRWEGRYTNCIGEVKSVYGKSKSDVRRDLKEITYNNDPKMFRDIRGDIELDIWFKHYIKIKKSMIKERSVNQIQLIYKTHISPVLGNILICLISPNDVINLITTLETKNLSQTYIENILTHTRAMFKFAAEEGVIARSPFLYVKKKRQIKKVRRNLTIIEVKHLLEVSKSMDYPMYLMICTMLYTGIRPGELCALKWNDFGADFSCVKIDESLTDSKFETSTKTISSIRTIPLIAFLQNEYKELFQYKAPQFDEHVFMNRCKRPYKTDNIDQKFRHLKKCISEIYPNDDFSDIAPHCLRHTFATAGINSGVPIKSMQALLGHANTRTLMDTYMHIEQNDQKVSINMIEEHSVIKLHTVELSDDETQFKKWSNVKRFKGLDNYKNELQHRLENI